MASCQAGLGDNDVVPVPAELPRRVATGSPIFRKGTFGKSSDPIAEGTGQAGEAMPYALLGLPQGRSRLAA